MKRIAVVTGGASGIGKAIARRLAEDGFHAVILDRNAEQLKSVVELYRGDGLDVEGRELDLTDATAVRRLVEDLPSVDALVNNAGLFDERGFFDADPQDFRRMYEINLVAVATLTQAVAAGMRPGGKVVNIASRAYLGARNHIHYVASKAALVGYTRACAMELGPRGILVNAVAPGLIDTPMLRALDPERMAAQLALQPTGRAGRPEDIANAVSFLADPKMEFITGQVIFVDGGKSMGGSGA